MRHDRLGSRRNLVVLHRYATGSDGRLVGVAACVGMLASALDQRHWSRRWAVALR
ncbi:hypothetical protein XAC2852_120205 [Xanthomonas citri pv. citri]|nr:hypothetical protein XAC902_100222 [Xanthomonas citri pv. citri]CEE56104.1 hypothetical protein XAC2852_120205 [Xanthomonas citri pv. citri]CEF22278.1 hypothetical protein XACJK2_170031 [Xanthomonas citri pv. citri]CEH50471.1 hypothetical protein XACLE3_630006 [Xanthomonas citri pv. citri]CEH62834.1 hypothetical protein XACG102_780003 [Xanthomonas citri pv. citri]